MAGPAGQRHRPAPGPAEEKIRALFAAFDGTYGYRRIHAELVRAGERVGAELVRN